MTQFRKDAIFGAAILVAVSAWAFVLWSGAKAADDRSGLVQALRTQTTITNANTTATRGYIQELDARLNAVVRFVAEHPGKKIPAQLLTIIPAPKLIPLTHPRPGSRVRSKSHGKEKHP